MKKIIFLSLMLICFQSFTQAQDLSCEYGKIGTPEILFAKYLKDTTAEAVVLFNTGNTNFERIDYSFDVVYERTTRIKIMSEAGIQWAKVEIPYYQEGNIYEKIEDLEACTYNMDNGRLTRTYLNKASCQNEKINESWQVRKFAMPNVKAGSIIEYRYKLRSQYKLKFRNWDFQWKIPVMYSEYKVSMIPFYEYTWLLQGATKFDSQTTKTNEGTEQQFGPIAYKESHYTFVMKDIPAFKDEEFISSENDYLIKLIFQLCNVHNTNGNTQKILTTWPEMMRDLLNNEDFGGYMNRSRNLASKVIDVKSLSALNQHEKFDSVMNYVKRNFNWNKNNDLSSSKSAGTFIKDKIGNVADINLFTIGLLNACGINATPVILSTRDHGKIKYDYPFIHFFNYVCILVNIDGKTILTDATEPLSLNDRIPETCINDKGLLIQKDKVEWVGLQSLVQTKIQEYISIQVSDSVQKGTIQSSSFEYKALDRRKDLGTNIKKIQLYINDKGYSVADSSITVKNQTNIKAPYQLKYKVVDNPLIVNGKIYVSPFLHETITENPLKQSERTYPVDMVYPKKNSYYSEISIPDGYKTNFLPSKASISNDLFDLEYSIVNTDSKIQINFVYCFKLPIYQPEDYSRIKDFFNEVINKGSEKIVFVKI